MQSWSERRLTVCEHALQKYLPLDLRPKKTRAIRRQMTKHQVHCSHSCCLWGLDAEVIESQIAFRRLSGLLERMPAGCLSANLEFASLLLQAGMQGGLVRVVLLLQVKARTEKQLKKDRAFPQRKFAIKA